MNKACYLDSRGICNFKGYFIWNVWYKRDFKNIS